MKKFITYSLLVVFFFGLLACIANCQDRPHPQVSVSTSASAQLAIEEEAPVLPDDFAKNDPPRVSANWITGEEDESKALASPAEITISRRRTKDDLDSWVRKNYTPKTQLSSDVSPRSQVLIHLVNEHKFKPNQVNGLDMWVALALHDAAHSKTIKADDLVTVNSVNPSAAGNMRDSGITLFTSDGTWRCGQCDIQKRNLSGENVSFDFKTMKVPAEGRSPTGSVPFWLGADGSTFEGAMTATQLETWAKLHGRHADPAKTHASSAVESQTQKPITTVEIDGSSSSAVLAALFEHINRSEIAHKSSSSDSSKSPQAIQGWLPEIDIDLDDPMLKILDAMMSADGYTMGGLKVSWPAGKRAVVFDPPVDVAYRKVLEVTSRVKSIEVNGREVLVRLDGRLIQDLRVKLK